MNRNPNPNPNINVLNTSVNTPMSKTVDATVGKFLSGLTLVFLILSIVFLVLYFITTLSGNVQKTITLNDGTEKKVTDIDNSYFGDLTARNIRYNLQIFTFLTIAVGILSLTRFMPSFLQIILGNIFASTTTQRLF